MNKHIAQSAKDKTESVLSKIKGRFEIKIAMEQKKVVINQRSITACRFGRKVFIKRWER